MFYRKENPAYGRKLSKGYYIKPYSAILSHTLNPTKILLDVNSIVSIEVLQLGSITRLSQDIVLDSRILAYLCETNNALGPQIVMATRLL